MADRVRPYRAGVNYWLFATDPKEYGFGHLELDTATVWDGVSDYVSLKHLRDIDEGELAFIFHTGTEMAIVGIARVTSDPYPDPRGSDPGTMIVDVVPERRLDPPVPFADFQDRPEFQEFDLVSQPELEVSPVTPEQWECILQMSHDAVANVTSEETL
jgi:predicted RNA-binding protein with PUA-like domain